MMQILVHRGRLVESEHQVVAVVADSVGNVIEAHGDSQKVCYLRSAIKPIQALPLILTGAKQKYQLSPVELALASASHNGEKFHVQGVANWLQRMGLSPSDLECGVHPPLFAEAAYELVRHAQNFGPIHNNCSGKHTGMLCVALQLQQPTAGYVQVEHKVQQMVKSVIEEITDYQIASQAYAIDGCSIPTWAISLKHFAMALARFADSDWNNKIMASACGEIFSACVNFPEFVAGTDRFCSVIMKECNKNVLVKTGAEGVLSAAIKAPRPLGIVVKCIDGAARAAEAAMAYLLNKYQVLPSSSLYLNKKILNWNKIETGFIEVQE